MKAGNIISFGEKRPGEQSITLRPGYHGTINACRQLLVKRLPSMMDALFERLDDVLYDLVGKAETDQLQSTYFEAMRRLRRDREQVESTFNKGVLARFDRFWTHGPKAISEFTLAADFNSETMGLMEEDDLEERLAITGMVSKGNNTFYRDLYALDQRFSYLLNGLKIEEDGNPLSPAALADAFKQAVIILAVDLPVKLVIYKQFEKQVFGRVGTLYDEVNATLAKAGILPEIRPVVRRGSAYRPATTTTDHPAEADSDPGQSAAESELFSTLQQLLRAQRPVQHYTNPSVPVQYIDSMALLSALSVIQHQHGTGVEQDGEVMDAGTVRSVVLKMPQIGQDPNKNAAINRSDEDTIDVITMLFEFILDDPALSDPMRALLGRLQIPMLKVAILDKTFFSRKDHPARRLLNTIAQAAIGWTEKSGRNGDGLYGQIDSVVRRILNEFDDDLGLFEELNEQLTAFLEREQRGAHVAEERAAQVTQGKEALVAAKRQVAEEIGRCLSEYQAVPDVAQNLVRDAWNDVLLLIYLRKGKESEEWINAVKLMERLIWSVMPKPTQNERQALLKSIPELLKGLRAGLADISYNQHKMTRAFKALQARHLACLRGGRALEGTEREDDTSEASAPGGSMEEIVLESTASTEATAEREGDQFDEQADALKIGSWLELNEQDGSTIRVKLSWRSAVSGNCLFVNRKGLKVAEVSGRGLADWLRSEKAVLLPEVGVPLMERALTTMVKTLNQSGKDKTVDKGEKK